MRRNGSSNSNYVVACIRYGRTHAEEDAFYEVKDTQSPLPLISLRNANITIIKIHDPMSSYDVTLKKKVAVEEDNGAYSEK